MLQAETMGRQVFPTALLLALALALPISWAHIGEEIPQAQELAVALPAPAPEDLLGRKSGGGGGGLSSAAYTVSEGPGPAPAPAPAPSGGGLGLGAGGGLGGGLGAGSSGGTTDVTTPASGGSEFDLVGTLFNGNAQAFTQAVLASGATRQLLAEWQARLSWWRPHPFSLPHCALGPPLPPRHKLRRHRRQWHAGPIRTSHPQDAEGEPGRPRSWRHRCGQGGDGGERVGGEVCTNPRLHGATGDELPPCSPPSAPDRAGK